MPLRQDEEFPPLTLDQQAEALRIAARLQVRHDEESAVEGMICAAEEAGIERRFLNEAVAQVVAASHKKPCGLRRWIGSRSTRRGTETRMPMAWVVMIILSGLVAFEVHNREQVGPFVLLSGLLFGLMSALYSNRIWRAPAAVFAAWVGMILVFALYSQISTGNTGMIDGRFFLWLVPGQMIATLVGTGLVRIAYPQGTYRPQSL